MGDYNWQKDSVKGEKWLHIMCTYSLQNVVKSYGRECLGSKTVTDHTFTSDHTTESAVL